MNTPIPFTGEEMLCAICGESQQSDITVESNWRYIALDRKGYYVCPKHFPADPATRRAYQNAYTKVLKRLIQHHRQEGGES